MSTAANVSTGKPRATGSIYRAPLGTTLPTNATTELNAAFKQLGYVSEDGLVNSNSPETDSIKAWGGDTVLGLQTEKEDTWQFTLLEVLNKDVQEAVYTSGNVSGDLDTGITIKANSAEMEEACWVFDMRLRGGVLKRVVLPDAKISEIGDITYKDDEAIGYELTLLALPDSDGQTHYEHIQKESTNSTGGGT